MYLHRLIVSAFIASIATCGVPALGEEYALRVRLGAEANKSALRAQLASKVAKTQKSASQEALLGSYPCYADAWARLKSLPPELAEATSIEVISPNEAELLPWDIETVDAVLMVTLPFKAEDEFAGSAKAVGGDPLDVVPAVSKSVAPSLLQKDVGQLTEDELLEVGLHAPTNKAGIPALERLLKEKPNSPRANQARLRLARRYLGRKDIGSTRTLLQAVMEKGTTAEKSSARLIAAYADLQDPQVDGLNPFVEIANDPGVGAAARRDARRRISHRAHAKRDYPTAWLAFRQIERDSDAGERAEAAVQLAGLAFELADSGKGTWEEVRQLCKHAANMPSATKQQKATANLMHLETRFKQGDLETCLAELETFFATDPPKRELAMSKLWQGVSNARLSRLSQAKTCLLYVTNMPLSSGDKFARQDPHAIALSWLSWIAKKEGDDAAAQAYAQRLQTEFPNSRQAKAVRGASK